MSIVQLALKRPYTFIVMAMLIVLATPFALRNMAILPPDAKVTPLFDQSVFVKAAVQGVVARR